jgi:hypothetical protein
MKFSNTALQFHFSAFLRFQIFFSLRISFIFASKNCFRFFAKRSETNTFFRYFASFFSLPFRFFSLQAKIRGHPNHHTRVKRRFEKMAGNYKLADFTAERRRLPGDSVVAENILLLLSWRTVVVSIAAVIVFEVVVVVLEVVVSEIRSLWLRPD